MKPRFSFVLLLASLGSISMQAQNTIERKFEWKYDGQPYELTMGIDQKVYDHFATLPRVIEDYSYYAASCETIPFVPNLVNGLVKLATEANLNRWQLVEMCIAFVQSLPYTQDNGYDHPRFPAETMADGTGDCEDTSILLAAILEEMGIDVALLSPPKHMGVGIACNGCSGTYYTSHGSKFFYVETTANGWEVGKVPEDLVGRNVKIIHIDRDHTIEQRLAKKPIEYRPKAYSRRKGWEVSRSFR